MQDENNYVSWARFFSPHESNPLDRIIIVPLPRDVERRSNFALKTKWNENLAHRTNLCGAARLALAPNYNWLVCQ